MAARVVDYSPLLTAPSQEDVAAYRARAKSSGAPWANVTVNTIVAVVIVVIVGTFLVIPMFGGIISTIIQSFGNANPIAVSFLLLFLILIALGVFAVIRGAVGGSAKWSRWVRMDRFARANGLAFSPADADPSYPGAIFSLGDSRKAIDHFRTLDGRFLDFGNYQYTTGSGKNRSTRTWGFLALKLDRKLPNMVLDARANNGLFGGTNLPAHFGKDQILSLEGDFNEFFTLYCPKEYERDALYVFTPDLMALLIDNAAPFDVEVVDDWMFVYSNTPFPAGAPAVYQRLFRIIETVGAKTLTQTDRYHDDRTAAPFTANMVAPQGARLKRTVSVGAIVITVVFTIFWGWGFVADILDSIFGG